jgi:AcrR family transcriptional regulator
MFSTIGFRATSLQMIADEVPCSKAALLYHFKTKTAILDDLVVGLSDDLAKVLDELAPSPEPDLARVLELSVALMVRNRAAMAMLRGLEDLAEVSPVVTLVQDRGERVSGLLFGVDPAPADRAAAHLFRHGVLGACLAMQDLSDDELATVLLQIGARIFELDPARLSRVSL